MGLWKLYWRASRQICLKSVQRPGRHLGCSSERCALCRAERWRSQRRTGAVELHAHVPLLIASCAPCDGPDGLPTGNGSAGITVVESASAAATITADFISEIFSLPTCAASSWRTPPSQPRARGLFDHLVGKRDQRRGKFDAKQL